MQIMHNLSIESFTGNLSIEGFTRKKSQNMHAHQIAFEDIV